MKFMNEGEESEWKQKLEREGGINRAGTRRKIRLKKVERQRRRENRWEIGLYHPLAGAFGVGGKKTTDKQQLRINCTF